MLRLSWQITLLSLILLPIFVIPARRMGRRLAALERESAAHNAAMTTQMTERFSAPGATLVKLFGRPSTRGRRVRQPRRAGGADRRALGDGRVRVHDGAGVGVGAGAGADLRTRRRARRARRSRRRHGRDNGVAARPVVRAADRAGERTGRCDGGVRQLRAGVRGARPEAVDRRAGDADADAGRAGERRARAGDVRLPRRRQGLARFAGRGGDARHARRRCRAARRLA